MRLKIFFVGLIATVVLAASANAAVIFDLVLDPATTAFSGVPDDGSGFARTSTRTGAGTWHLYAVDDNAGSLGIANYSVALVGATATNHRSPLGSAADLNGDPFNAGFHLGRTGTNIQPMQGSQAPTDLSPWQIYGYGQQASNFNAKILAIDAAATGVTGTTNGQWGNYATDPAPFNGRNWLFVGEGTYAVGTAPTFNMQLTTAQTFGGQNQFLNSEICIGAVDCRVGVPPDAQDFLHPQMDGSAAANPMPIMHTFTQVGGTPPVTWDGFMLESYTANYGGGGPGPLALATFDPLTQKFSWNPIGSPRGDYVWKATATNAFGSDVGRLSVAIKSVPEPATLSLLGLALVGGLGYIRRR